MIDCQVYKKSSCMGDNGLDVFLKKLNIKVNYKNIQTPCVRRKYYQIIKDNNLEEYAGVFPLLIFGDKIIVGFKSNEILKIISEVK